MATRTAAKKAKKPAVNDHVMLSVDLLDPRPNNARGKITRESVLGLMQSIKEEGYTTPLLVRPLNGRYQIVGGERRWRSAKFLKLGEVPVYIEEMTDEQAAYRAAIDNLQRENLHPLDEALEFWTLVDKANGAIATVARKLGKPEKHIIRRLPLSDLIAEAQDDFRNGLIGIEHAMELARIPEKGIQLNALNACYQSIWTPKEGNKPNRNAPPRHVSALRSWIEQHIFLDLADAPFKLDDTRLREDGKACVDCPERTGTNPALFDDLADKGDKCLNRPCFNGKMQTFVQLEARRIAPKGSDKPAPMIVPWYDYTPDGELPADQELLRRENVTIIATAKEKCASAERAVWPAGPSIGKSTWFCRDSECPDHAAATYSRNSHSSSNGARITTPAEKKKKNDRKQEIFDIKVAENVRRRVFREVLKTFTHPMSLKQRELVAVAFFERIPTEHKKVICEILGWEYEKLGGFHDTKGEKRRAYLMNLIQAMNEDELTRFMALMRFIHYGTGEYFKADQYAGRLFKQDDVEGLAMEHDVNYALIDAEVRLEQSSKKYRLAHERYLEAIKAGESATKPKVYEGAIPAKAKPKKAAKVEDGASEPEETDDDLSADECEEEE